MATALPIDWGTVDARDRRVIVVASQKTADDLQGRIDWRAISDGDVPLSTLASNAVEAIPALRLYRLFVEWLGNRSKFPYPVLEPSTARTIFKFPLNHPNDGLVYACSPAEPMHYVPLSGFHRYMYEFKMAAFHELCAALGAKQCKVVYAEVDGRETTAHAHVTGIPSTWGSISVGGKSEHNEKHSQDATVVMSFPPPTGSPTGADTGWLVGEPTWISMQRLRLERGLEKYRAEFSYADDMGVDAEAAAKIGRIGLKIGGQFEAMQKRKWIFDVEFWPMKSPRG
jgi:hypothetical protein